MTLEKVTNVNGLSLASLSLGPSSTEMLLESRFTSTAEQSLSFMAFERTK
jgi:hypothetical protein